MSTLTVNKVTINRPVIEVYEFATNMENFSLWFPEVINIKSDNSLDHGCEGKKYLETVQIPFGGISKISLTVVKSMQNQLFVTEGDFSPLLPKMIMKFSEDTSNTTNLTWCMKSRNNSLIFKALVLPIFKKIISKRAVKGVRNLKSIMEKQALK